MLWVGYLLSRYGLYFLSTYQTPWYGAVSREDLPSLKWVSLCFYFRVTEAERTRLCLLLSCLRPHQLGYSEVGLFYSLNLDSVFWCEMDQTVYLVVEQGAVHWVVLQCREAV